MLSSSWAITIHKAGLTDKVGPTPEGGGESACPCVTWAKAYGRGGVDSCMAKGLEPFAEGLGGLAGAEFCNFVTHLNSNACLEREGGMEMDPEEPLDSVCFIDSACAYPDEAPAWKFVQKTCSSASDTLVSDMPAHDLVKLATDNGVEPGVMAAYGSVWVNKPVANITQEDINKYKAAGHGIFIWSEKNNTADRLHIKGKEVYKHTFVPAQAWKAPAWINSTWTNSTWINGTWKAPTWINGTFVPGQDARAAAWNVACQEGCD